MVVCIVCLFPAAITVVSAVLIGSTGTQTEVLCFFVQYQDSTSSSTLLIECYMVQLNYFKYPKFQTAASDVVDGVERTVRLSECKYLHYLNYMVLKGTSAKLVTMCHSFTVCLRGMRTIV